MNKILLLLKRKKIKISNLILFCQEGVSFREMIIKGVGPAK